MIPQYDFNTKVICRPAVEMTSKKKFIHKIIMSSTWQRASERQVIFFVA